MSGAPETTKPTSVRSGAVAAPAPLDTPSDHAPLPTHLAELLAAGRFVVSVEIDPPRSIRIERTIEAARLLRDAGVDLVNVSDSAMARRSSSFSRCWWLGVSVVALGSRAPMRPPESNPCWPMARGLRCLP